MRHHLRSKLRVLSMSDTFQSLHHICLVVHDLDKAAAYYQSIGIGPWRDFPSFSDFSRLDMPDLEGFHGLKYKFANLQNVQLQLCQPAAACYAPQGGGWPILSAVRWRAGRSGKRASLSWRVLEAGSLHPPVLRYHPFIDNHSHLQQRNGPPPAPHAAGPCFFFPCRSS